MITIVDVNGKERQAKSVKKIIHKVPDVINGGTVDEEYVEVEIVGQHRKGTWKEWYPLKKFVKMNPNVKL